MRDNKGLILAITIIFVLILVIMSGTVLLLMTNHARVTETQIRRVKSVDAAESAALVKAYDELRTGTGFVPLMPPPPNDRYYNPTYLSNFNGADVSLCVAPNTGVAVACGSEPALTCPTTSPKYCVRAKVRYLE